MTSKCFRYRAWGLDMAVPMRVPELAEHKATMDSDWELRIGAPPDDRDCQRFTLPNGARAALAGSKLAYVETDRMAAALHPSLLRSVIAPVLRQRGCVALHGSAVELDGRTLVFAGPSGSGKTTLAAAACAMGGRLLTDELCAIGWEGGRPIVLPGSRLLALHPDALALIGRNKDDASPIPGDGLSMRNGRILTSVAAAEQPQEPDALCLLGWTQNGAPSIIPIDGVALASAFINARYQADIGPKSVNAMEVPQISKLVSKCPILRLDRLAETPPIQLVGMLREYRL